MFLTLTDKVRSKDLCEDKGSTFSGALPRAIRTVTYLVLFFFLSAGDQQPCASSGRFQVRPPVMPILRQYFISASYQPILPLQLHPPPS